MLSCSVGAVNDCNEGGFHAKTVPATTSGSWKNSSSGRRSNTSLLPINPRTTSPSPLGPCVRSPYLPLQPRLTYQEKVPLLQHKC